MCERGYLEKVYLWTTRLIRGHYVEISSRHLCNPEQRESAMKWNPIYIYDTQLTYALVGINVEQRKLVFSMISRLIKDAQVPICTNHECHSQNSMRNNNLPAFRNPALEYNGEIQDRNHKIHQKRSRERSKIRYYFHNTGKCKTIGRNNKRKHTEMRERDRTKTIET